MSWPIVSDNKYQKIIYTKDYKSMFNKKTGAFMRWGKTDKDDPDWCPLGPEILDLEVSEICSQGCKHCYKSNTSKGRNMSFDTFHIIIDKLPKTVGQIAFGIGDLRSNPDLPKMFDYCRVMGIVPNVTINGHLSLDDAEWLAKMCGAVAVSNYNKEDCYHSVQLLSALGLNLVNIHQLLSEETFDTCLNLLHDFKEDEKLSVHLNAIVFLWLKNKGKRNNYHQISSMDKYKTLVDYALDNNLRIGFDSCSASSFLKAVKDRPNFEDYVQMSDSCESTLFSYYITVEGVGFPCSFSEGEKGFKGIDVVGANDFMKDVWNGKETKEFRARLLKTKDCNNCRNCPVFKIGV